MSINESLIFKKIESTNENNKTNRKPINLEVFCVQNFFSQLNKLQVVSCVNPMVDKKKKKNPHLYFYKWKIIKIKLLLILFFVNKNKLIMYLVQQQQRSR